jgi:hypothetical protein
MLLATISAVSMLRKEYFFSVLNISDKFGRDTCINSVGRYRFVDHGSGAYDAFASDGYPGEKSGPGTKPGTIFNGDRPGNTFPGYMRAIGGYDVATIADINHGRYVDIRADVNLT